MPHDELRCEWFYGAGRLGLGIIAEVRRPRWKLLPAPLPADVVLRSCTGLPPEGQSFLDAYLIDSKRLEHFWAICTVMICFGRTCWPGLITVYTCPLDFQTWPRAPDTHYLFGSWFILYNLSRTFGVPGLLHILHEVGSAAMDCVPWRSTACVHCHESIVFLSVPTPWGWMIWIWQAKVQNTWSLWVLQ